MTLSSDEFLQRVLPAWTTAQLRRLLEEISLMEENHPDFRLVYLGEPNIIGWQGVIEAEGTTLRILLICESTFPQRSPYVLPLTQDLEFADLRDSYHQNPNKTLCLFARGTGPNGWHPSIHMTEVVRRAKEHLARTVQGTHVDIHEDWYDPTSGVRCEHEVVLPHQLDAWWRIATQRVGAFHYGVLPGDKTVVVTCIEPLTSVANEWESVLGSSSVRKEGVWIRDRVTWRNLTEVFKGSLTEEEFFRRIEQRHGRINPGGSLLLRNTVADSSEAWLVNCPLCTKQRGSSSAKPVARVRVLNLEEKIYSRVPEDVSLRELQQSRVMFIGCGSLGSAVLQDLVTSGIGKFILVDPDVVTEENVLRHTASLKDLYRPKVKVLEEAILARNPLCSVEAIPYDLFAELMLSLRKNLAEKTDLIISTVADSVINQLVNQYGIEHRIPMVFASVLGTGLGGRVFRVIPGETPCFTCCAMLQTYFPGRFIAYSSEVDESIPVRAGASYRAPAVPGLARDIAFVAGITSRLAEQTLLGDGRKGPLFNEKLGDHLLWSNRPGWKFEKSFQLVEELYKKVPECPDCGSSVDEPLDEDTKSEIRRAFVRNERKSHPWDVTA